MQAVGSIVSDLEDCLHKIANQIHRVHMTGDAEFECYLRQQLELLTQKKETLLGQSLDQSPPRLLTALQSFTPVKDPLQMTQLIPSVRRNVPPLFFPKRRKPTPKLTAQRYDPGASKTPPTFALGRTRVFQQQSFSVPHTGTNPFLA